MDVLVEFADNYFLNRYLYNKLSKNIQDFLLNNLIYRQSCTIYLLLTVGGLLFYLFFSSLSYIVFLKLFGSMFFGSRTKKPKIKHEIKRAVTSIPVMGILTTPFVLPEVRGYSKLYGNVDQYGYLYFILSFIIFLIFTDFCIYWIHRTLHLGIFYKYIHKDHHAYIDVMSPFASHAFHPVDGFLQGLPYHLFVYIFPMHKWMYITMFVIVNMWTISIHDMVYFSRFNIINGAAHHTLHHLKFRYNYGQYFTFWDRVCGTHQLPPKEQLDWSYIGR